LLVSGDDKCAFTGFGVRHGGEEAVESGDTLIDESDVPVRGQADAQGLVDHHGCDDQGHHGENKRQQYFCPQAEPLHGALWGAVKSLELLYYALPRYG
jgi:hypothetical protein